MKTNIPSKYRGGMALAMATSALVLFAPTIIRAEVVTVTDHLGGFSQTYPVAVAQDPHRHGNYPFELYTQVAHSNGKTYVVMVDDTGHPKVTQITEAANGTASHVTKNLDLPDYRALHDPHNGYSIGIDKNGYIHIAGDMHGFGTEGDSRSTDTDGNGIKGDLTAGYVYGSVNENYPARYQSLPTIPESQRARIMYWVSKRSLDITTDAEPFEFAGYDSDPRRIPGTGWSYGRFFNDKDGNLYYSARVTAADRHIGLMGVSLSSYNTTTKTWTTWGEAPPYEIAYPLRDSRFGTLNPVVYWAEAGEPPTEGKKGDAVKRTAVRNYQVYQAGFNFDENKRLHFVVSGFVDLYGKARVLYAYTDSFKNGPTPSSPVAWYRADGSAIPRNLLRGDVTPDVSGGMTLVYPEVTPTLEVNDNVESDLYDDTWASGVANPTEITKVFADGNGKVYALHGKTYVNWRVWIPKTGTAPGQWVGSIIGGGDAGTYTPRGLFVTWNDYGIWRNGNAVSVTGPKGIISPCQQTIQKTGVAYGLVRDTSTTPETTWVRKVAFTTPASTSTWGFNWQSWTGIGGMNLSALTSNANYPLLPSASGKSPDTNPPGNNQPTFFIQHTTAEANGGTGNRVRAYFIPPTTGSYVFKVLGNFSGILYVSPNDQPHSRVAVVTLNTPSTAPVQPWQWDKATASAPIALVAGQRYFIELIHKGASANPHVAVGATSSNTFAELPLLASRLAAWAPKPPYFISSFAISNVTSSQAKLAANAADDYEESALKYSWAGTGPGSVTFSAQNTNAAKNCTAQFSTVGTYTVTLTVKDADGLSATNTRSIVVK